MTDTEIRKFAHDINNILLVIVSNAELILSSMENNSEFRQDMRDLLTAAEQGVSAVRGLQVRIGREPAPEDLSAKEHIEQRQYPPTSHGSSHSTC